VTGPFKAPVGQAVRQALRHQSGQPTSKVGSSGTNSWSTHKGYGQDPGTPADYFVGIEKTILAEGPKAGSGRSHPMRQMERHLGIDSVILEKPTKSLDAFGQTVFGDPVIIQVTAAEMTLQRGREAWLK